MILDNWTPDMVIGVDFGMTATGVAYSEAPEWNQPRPLQHWPGKIISELANKVPTVVGYLENSEQVKMWGFLCDLERQHEDLDFYQCFKLNLDPEHKDFNANAPTVAQARKWFQDYLRCVYGHIETYFSDSYPRWSSMKVEFVFSVPTSWNNPSMIAELEKLIAGAGFGMHGPHKVHTGLTEAEAAAVYAAGQHYQKDDVILVCDAGGGTTDVNVLKLDSSRGEPTRLKQLGWVEGQAIGSALIDFRFHKLITDRLRSIHSYLRRSPDDTADIMLRNRFEKIKCSFGTEASNFPEFTLQVDGLAAGSNFPQLGIRDGEMVFQRGDMKRIFDAQADAMLTLIDAQLQRMEKHHPNERVSYLVMSGGLGSSPYIRTRLKEHYEGGLGGNRANVGGMRILLSPEPQLAVVQGLVMDRKEANRGNVVFDERCCRVSYGMLCRQLYNPVTHIGEEVYYDPRDKRKWAIRQIDWFVEQGKTISSRGVSHSYRLKLGLRDPYRNWKTYIVMSTAPLEQRPNSILHAGDSVKTVCEVNARLDDIDCKIKNRRWYNRGPKYLRAEFDVKTLIGPADLKFQVWSKNGVCKTNHDSIDVTWDPPRTHSMTGNDDMSTMYRN